MTNDKIQNKSKFQITKQIILIFVLCAYFVICVLSFGFLRNSYALNLDKVKVNFLSGDYKAAILEGEKILATTGETYELDELYYILALSYLKDGNYLRASDIFEIILKEFKDSMLTADAQLGVADTYFLKSDYERAQERYKDLLNSKQADKFKSLLYYCLSRCAAKLGDSEQAKNYLDKLRQEFPLNILDSRIDNNIVSAEFYYSVQVGSFSSNTNANNLMRELIRKGYSAYIEEADSQGVAIYRVKVGKIRLRQETVVLANKLSQEGYPTKVCP